MGRIGRVWQKHDRIEATGIFLGLLVVAVFIVMMTLDKKGMDALSLACLFGFVYLGAAAFMALLYMRRDERE